jgi:hypothetical protein
MISTGLNPPQSVWNSLIPFWQTIFIFFLSQSVWKVVYAVQMQRRESQKLLTNGQCPLYFLAEAIPCFIYIKFYHRANNRGKYADGFSNSMIDDKDGHIPSPLIMFTCTALRHALLEWQKHKGVHPKASNLKLKADRPDRSNYINCKNDGGKIVSCCAVTGRKLLTSPGVADTYIFLMNTSNPLPESYQQRVYNNTLATVKRQIQQAENPTPAVVISVEPACVVNAIVLDYLTSEVAIEEPEMGSTDPNIPMDNNCTDDELHFGMPGGSGVFEDEGDESDVIPTASWRRRAETELERFDLGTSDVDGYEGEDGDNADEEEEASQADDGSTQNVED